MSNITATEDGRPVDLRITAASEYVGRPQRNRVKAGAFGVINVASNTTTVFRFELVDSETGVPAVTRHFYMTFFDLDRGINESVTLQNFSLYWVSEKTEVDVFANGSSTTFRSTEKGTGEDNPDTLASLSHEQMNRAFTVLYENTSQFNVSYRVDSKGYGRNFMFAGWSRPNQSAILPNGTAPPVRHIKMKIRIRMNNTLGGCMNGTNGTNGTNGSNCSCCILPNITINQVKKPASLRGVPVHTPSSSPERIA